MHICNEFIAEVIIFGNPMFDDLVNSLKNTHTPRPFLKMHAQGNHFIVADGRTSPYTPCAEETAFLCDSKTGIGADQLIIIEQPGSQGAAKGAIAFMKVINVDGRQVPTCGNATRCVGDILLRETLEERIRLETGAGVLECRRTRDKKGVSVNMGRIKTGWQDIPLARKIDTKALPIDSGPLKEPDALNIGSPHAVFYVEDLDAVDMHRFAPAIQNHSIFPEGINVGIAQVLDPKCLRLTVFERPGILTRACGSGACAAVFGAQKRDLLLDETIKVKMPGGELEVQILPDGSAILSGQVSYSFTGYLPQLDFNNQKI